jgi:serine/threonine protein kinase
VDIWALGVVVYKILQGSYPYEDEDFTKEVKYKATLDLEAKDFI